MQSQVISQDGQLIDKWWVDFEDYPTFRCSFPSSALQVQEYDAVQALQVQEYDAVQI